MIDMTPSITCTAAMPVLPPVSFSLEVYGPTARRLEREDAKQIKSTAEQHRAKVRKIRHDMELEAAEMAQTLQQRLIARALEPGVDLKLLADITWKLSERGVGRVRDAESDAPAKDKDAAAQGILELLASFSTKSLAVEMGGKAAPRIERDVTPEQGQYLDLNEFDVGGEDDA